MPGRSSKDHGREAPAEGKVGVAVRLPGLEAAAASCVEGPRTSGTAAVRERPAQVLEDEAGASEDDGLERVAAMVLSALEAGASDRVARQSPAERRMRRTGRVHCRLRAHLTLWADGKDGEAWTLFTRDIDARAMGFICQDRLPLGYGGTLSFTGPGLRRGRIDVTVTRCRPCSAGWFEGALHFSEPQPWLVEELTDFSQN